MHNAVIIAALRTPLGAYRGSLRYVSPADLGGTVARALIEQTHTSPEEIGETIFGNVLGSGLGQNPARQVAARAGIPFSSSALTIDMVCGSGLRAVCLASQGITLGEYEAVIAGGTESMSKAPYIILKNGSSEEKISSLRHDGLRCAFDNEPMGKAAEWLAATRKCSRTEQDRYALDSHRKATESIQKGLFKAEIVFVNGKSGGKAISPFDTDECPRPDCSMEFLSNLKPAFTDDGTITAGNATPIADGAAAALITTESYAKSKNIQPLARIVSYAIAGVPPREAFLAPVPAIKKLLSENGLAVHDIDLFELGDSFAVEGLLCQRELNIDPSRMNVRGGALALGHPLGASGCRILVTLIHALKDSRKRYGVAAICLGGGNAVALLVEAIPNRP
jgi:acetyl-CoA C-acetyltransferase